MISKLTIALPKGRVMAESLELLGAVGLNLQLSNNKRTLRHDNSDASIIELRNADVPTYVELGVADLGIVGKDVLRESDCNIYEPLDLGFSSCRVSLIRVKGDGSSIERIASKYPRITSTYLKSKGLNAQAIKLSGNVELACLTGLANAVIDVVETGSTLQANNLEEVETIFHSSAHLIVNRAALKTKQEQIRPLVDALRTFIELKK